MTPEEAQAAFDAAVVAAGHTLVVDEDGEVDHFVCSEGFHNGPGCSVCGARWCQHCGGEIEPCDGGKWKAEYEAKRRVEVAAHDLLDALKELRTVGNDLRARKAARAKADAAIRKAEGLQSLEGDLG